MSNKELIYLKGLAKGRRGFKTLHAINAAVILHKNQMRKDGDDFIKHPLRVASELAALGLKDDVLLATALLHDVIEDCDITSSELKEKYGIDKEVIKYIEVLSYEKNKTLESYYEEIAKSPITLLVKISDRCHNISTMSGAFEPAKIKSYIQETEEYVLPLCKYGKDYYPEYSDQIFVMKYHIESLIGTVKKITERITEENNG